MNLNLEIPDDIATRLMETGDDLARRALEGLALEEFKVGHITAPELRRLPGFGTRWQLDGFLKARGVYDTYTLEDFEEERASVKSARF